MKVAFVSRETLFTGKGGDTVQMLNTAEYLRKLGLEVDIYLGSQKIDYDQYDVLHGFNVIRPADILHHFAAFPKTKVLSTIYVDYFEFETKARGKISTRILKIIGKNRTEYIKTLFRWVLNGEKNFSLAYLFLGHKKSVEKLIKLSDVLLPNSNSEYNRLKTDFTFEKKYFSIPNAINADLFKINNEVEKDNNLVISIAKIDGRKNQINLIKALNNTRFKLLIIGKCSPNHLKYYNNCKAAAASNVEFIEELEQIDLIKFYQKAKVHAMPSWFETTGLSSLEALAMGCNIVITKKGDTEEYFKDKAFYCEPDSPESILKAVEQASMAGVDLNFINYINKHYIWNETALQTLQAYNQILHK
jgi:glycosyltransferase involved in cell wall biosynthesis